MARESVFLLLTLALLLLHPAQASIPGDFYLQLKIKIKTKIYIYQQYPRDISLSELKAEKLYYD